MLPKMQREPLRQEVQRAVRQRERQAVGAVLLLGQQAARVLADLAGGAQRVRPDDARERARARRRRARRRARARRDVRRRSRGRRRDPATRTARAARSAREGRRRRQRPGGAAAEPLQAARLGSDPEQGRDLDLLEGRLSRHRPRRRRDDGAADRQQATAGSGTSRCTTTSSASASWRRSTTCSRAASGHEQTYHEEVERCPAVKAADRRRDARRPATSRRRTTRIARPRSPATAGCWSATRSASSIRCTRRACCWRCKSGELAADAIVEGLASGRHERGAARASGEPASTRASIACGGWSASTTTASASARSCAGIRICAARHRSADRRPVHRSRRLVWPAMESLYDGGRTADPRLGRRHSPAATSRGAALTVPDDHRPSVDA